MKFKVGIGKNNKNYCPAFVRLSAKNTYNNTLSSSELRDGPHFGFLLQILKITCMYLYKYKAFPNI